MNRLVIKLLLLVLVGCDPRALSRVDATSDLYLSDQLAHEASRLQPHRFVEVAAGGYVSCGIRDDGQLTCWGAADDRPPEPINGRFKAVDIDFDLICALQENGELVSWGIEEPPPPGSYLQVAARLGGCCAIREDGFLRCWGPNTIFNPHYIQPPDIQLISLAMASIVGCGLVQDSTARCWGVPSYARVIPQDVPLSSVSPGSVAYCGILKSTGEARCWYLPSEPVDPFPGIKPVQLGSGQCHACVLLNDGTIQCWFSTEKLGDPNDPLPNRGYPPIKAGFTKISIGPRHGCAIHQQGHIECWGENSYGQRDAPDPNSL